MKQYRALVVCSQDPCLYCHRPAQEHVPGKSLSGGPDFTQPTYAEALAYGRSMSRKVYGYSVHHVLVQVSEVSEWTTVTPEES